MLTSLIPRKQMMGRLMKSRIQNKKGKELIQWQRLEELEKNRVSSEARLKIMKLRRGLQKYARMMKRQSSKELKKEEPSREYWFKRMMIKRGLPSYGGRIRVMFRNDRLMNNF